MSSPHCTSRFGAFILALLVGALPLGRAIAGTSIPGAQAFVADPAFGDSGAAIVDFQDAYATWDEPLATFPADDGGYWVIGLHRPDSGADRLAIGKLDANGQPDLTFGDQGKTTADVAGVQIDAATMDGDRIYVAAVISGNGADFAISCLLVDGTPCAGFGMAGQVIVPFDVGGSHDDIANRIVVRDGSLYVSGDVSTDGSDGAWDLATGVAKLDATSGVLDAQFGNLSGKPGRSVFNIDLIANGAEYNAGLALSNDGTRLLLTGSTDDTDPATGDMLQDAFVLAADPVTGQIDPGFADAGVRIVTLPPGESFGQIIVKQILVRHNDRIVVVGDYWHDIGGVVLPEITLIEMDAQGSLSGDFGDDGVTHLLVGNNTETQGVAERPGSGRLVVAAKNDGLDPDDSTDHQQSLIEFSAAGTSATSAVVFTFPSDGTNTAIRSYPKGDYIDAANRTLIWGWRNWEYTQGPFVLNRDITLSRFLDEDAIFGNSFGGLYAD